MADNTGIFTPFENRSSNHRLKMQLSTQDAQKIGRGRWGPVEVTDLNTGAVVEVQGADCGAGCHCAAEIVRVVKPGDRGAVEYLD